MSSVKAKVVIGVLELAGRGLSILKLLSEIFCRHKIWMALEPIISDLDDDLQSVTWRRMECAGCGKVRKTAMLKPGEEVVVGWN